MRGSRTLVVVVLGLGIVFAGAPAVASAAPGDATAAPAADLGWSPCPTALPGPPDDELQLPPVPLECATLPVPLDHDRPGGRHLALALFRLPAVSPATRLGSLVMNPGGPGAPTRDFLAAVSGGIPAEVAARYDLVTFDPRGVGASEGLACGGLDLVVDSDDPFAGQQAFGELLGAQCRAEDSELVARMSSTDIARDLDLVRAALGDDQLTYLGYSWGALLGAVYAELHPARVGRMVLDGVLDPNISYLDIARQGTVAAEEVLAAFFARCDADPDCALAPHGSEAVWRYLAWKARAEGLSSSDGRRMGFDGFLAATYAALSAGRPAFPVYARFLLEAAQGDATSLIDVAEAYDGIAPAGSFYAIICGDDAQRYSRDGVQAASYELLTGQAPNLYLGVVEVLGCAGFPPSPTVQPTVALTPGEVAPILIVGTTLDPATPYRWAVSLNAAVGGSRLLTFEGEGHTIAFAGIPCIDGAVAAYLLGGVLPPAGARCVSPG